MPSVTPATTAGRPPSPVPVVDAVATPDGNGYWLLFANGVVDNFGDATNFGAPIGYVNGFNPATTIFPTADGQGYWVASARGDVFSYGDSPFLGSRRPPASTARSSPPSASRALGPERLVLGQGQLRHDGLDDRLDAATRPAEARRSSSEM